MLLHSKETINKMKRQPLGWEKIFVNYISDRSEYPKSTRNSYNSTANKTDQNKQRLKKKHVNLKIGQDAN